MNKWAHRTLAAVAGLSLAFIPTAPSNAAEGNRSPIELDGTFIVNDLCDFPVTITAHVDGYETVVETANGSILRSNLHERDVFSANGNTLQGSYIFQLQLTLDEEGNVVRGYQTGVIVRVPLPNGDTFAVTGRADALAAQTDYISAPTYGVTRNLDEFCAYLAS